MSTFRKSHALKLNTAILVGTTLLTGGLFKISAFLRETFIASHFGLSSVTDAYFGLQQFPLALATFMFGAFSLAFTPAYAEARRREGHVVWMPGLLFYGCAIGTLLTLALIWSGPALLKVFALAPSPENFGTLAVLSVSCVPIVCIGFWAAICAAQGGNLRAMSMTGMPYLVMTAMLFLMYGIGVLGNRGLAISMTAGFAILGTYAFIRNLRSMAVRTVLWSDVLMPWRLVECRRFIRNLTTSSIENAGYAANQLFLVYFLARSGTGMISANNFAMRIGMLGYTLFSQPLAQLMQARLCVSDREGGASIFRRWLVIVWVGMTFIAAGLYWFRFPLIRIVYMRGHFTGTELQMVAAILPAWIAYVIVLSLNAVVARYLFTASQGATYVRYMLCGYTAANLLRIIVADRLSAPWIIWCSVIAEGCATLASLRFCLYLSRQPKVFGLATNEEVVL